MSSIDRAAPDTMWGVSVNCQGGVLPTPALRNRVRDKFATITDWLGEGASFVCLQDLGQGFRENDAPAELTDRLGQHSIVCAGSQDDPSGTVAIIVHESWHVLKVLRVAGSSRCIGVEMMRGNFKMLVVSVYLQPGMDSAVNMKAGRNRGRSAAVVQRREKRLEAYRILRCVREWMRAHDAFHVCGDFNQDPPAETEATRGNKRRARPADPLSVVLLKPTSPAADLFKSLGELRPTRKNGRRRIDYILVHKDHLLNQSQHWQCELQGELASDHFALKSTFPVPPIQHTVLPRRPNFVPDLGRATEHSKKAFVDRCNNLLTDLDEEWSCNGEDALQDNMSSVADAIWQEVVTCLPNRGSRAKGREDRETRVLRKTARYLRALVAQVDSLVCGQIGLYNRSLHSAATNLTRVGFGIQGWRQFTVVDWSTWGAAAVNILEVVTAKLATAYTRKKSRMTPLSDQLWARGKGNREFYRRLLRGSSQARVDSAVDPKTGARVWDRSRYPSLVAAQVGHVFQDKVEQPPGSADSSYSPRLCTGACGGEMSENPGQNCQDVRCTGGLPAWWWDYYGPGNVSEVGRKVFGDVMRPADIATVGRVVDRVPADKSPGRDGVSSALLQLLADPKFNEPGMTPPIIEVITKLTNDSFRLGHVPKHAKDGLIRMIPKGGDAGVIVNDVGCMRPITLLSELGKVASRILADRIATVFANVPSLLHPSQRAFQRNGDTGQCVDMALDVLEDHHQQKPSSGLYCISYDQAKAYDSVQQYSIRCTLERFGFPPSAVSFFCSTLDDAWSAVVTDAGPTGRFPVLSSVRQGDPCAPILFIMVADVLHRGYLDGHAGPVDGLGYTFQSRRGRPLTVASCGYADDVLVFAETARGLQRMHDWTREFFGAHSFKLNTGKTKLTSTQGDSQLRGTFFGVNGQVAVKPIPATQDFRYLGVRIALDMSWEAELQRLENHVNHVISAIRTHRMSCTTGVDAVNSYLVPQLDLGIRIIPHSSAFMSKLREWRDRLQDAILLAQGAWLSRPNRAAFCQVTGMVDLPRYCRYTRAAITAQRLNTSDEVLPPTAWARLSAVRPDADKAGLLAEVSRRRNPSGKNRILDALVAHGLGNVRYEYNCAYFSVMPVVTVDSTQDSRTDIDHVDPMWWMPSKSPNRLFRTQRDDLSYHVYPDGSTGVGSDRRSAYAAVIVDCAGRAKWTGSHLSNSGSNYPAEMAGILAGILACPGQARVHVHTDCLGAMQAILRRSRSPQFDRLYELGESRWCVSESERIRAGARPILTSIRKIIDARSGEVTFDHVRSHTGASDEHSKWNEAADFFANECRRRAPGRGGPPFHHNEEKVVITINRDHVHGDFRLWAKREAAKARKAEWARAAGHVSRVIRECPGGIDPLCEIVRKRGDAEEVLLLLEALCSRLPCGHRFSRTRDGPMWPIGAWDCPACEAPGLETPSHILSCPSTDCLRSAALHKILRAVVPGDREATLGGRALPSPEASADPLWVHRLTDTFGVKRERSDVQGTGAGGGWQARFLLVVPVRGRASAVLRKAHRAAKAHRPTRVVVVLHVAAPPRHWAIQHAEWVARGPRLMVLLFQNEIAEAVLPCRNRLAELCSSLGLDARVNVQGRAWPTVPDSAWSLRRAWKRDGAGTESCPSWHSFFDIGRATGVPSRMAYLSKDARGAARGLNDTSVYARRLGVVCGQYSNVLRDVMSRPEVTGKPASFAAVDAALLVLRTAMWDSARAAFRAARQARVWMYENDPCNQILQGEEDRVAQRLFELRRNRARGIYPRRQRVSKGAFRRRSNQPRCAPVVRRSSRQRRRPMSTDFHYNWGSDYVMALDEIDAPTNSGMHPEIADRMKRARRHLSALV